MIEKILERLEEGWRKYLFRNEDFYNGIRRGYDEAMKIVQEVAKEYGKDTNVRSNEEKYKLALFAVVRNQLMPIGATECRSIEEIGVMALMTMNEMFDMCQYDALRRRYEEAEEALAKMGGK